MRGKITVIGERAGTVRDVLSAGDRCDVVVLDGVVEQQLAGSDVVVALDGVDAAAVGAAVARRASGAVLLVATGDPEGDCRAALRASLLPRPRVVGLRVEDVGAACEAVLYGHETQVQAAVYCRGELGIEDRVATVPARLGSGGVKAIGA